MQEYECFIEECPHRKHRNKLYEAQQDGRLELLAELSAAMNNLDDIPECHSSKT